MNNCKKVLIIKNMYFTNVYKIQFIGNKQVNDLMAMKGIKKINLYVN